MSQDAQIDEIVREVLLRLNALSLGVATPGLAAATTNHTSLVLSQRLITQRDLEGQLDGRPSVAVPAGAVVTPAARDYLRERGVSLIRGDAKAVLNGRPVASLIFGVAETKFDPTELTYVLKRQGIEIERLANTGLATVVEELSDHVARGGRMGLLLTDEPAAASCLANRIRGVRAAVASDIDWVESAIHGIGVNLLIVPPRGRGIPQLKQIVGRFTSGAPHACPAELREGLG